MDWNSIIRAVRLRLNILYCLRGFIKSRYTLIPAFDLALPQNRFSVLDSFNRLTNGLVGGFSYQSVGPWNQTNISFSRSKLGTEPNWLLPALVLSLWWKCHTIRAWIVRKALVQKDLNTMIGSWWRAAYTCSIQTGMVSRSYTNGGDYQKLRSPTLRSSREPTLLNWPWARRPGPTCRYICSWGLDRRQRC